MAHKSLVPKLRDLLPPGQETQSSFEAWLEAMNFHISLSDKSTRFLPTGDLSTWTLADDRGFTDDEAVGTGIITAENKMNKQAKANLLNVVLGSIAGHAPVVNASQIKKHSTSLEQIWDRLRAFYGWRRTGCRILELMEVKPDPGESRESLWERFFSFIDDQMLTKDGPVIRVATPPEHLI